MVTGRTWRARRIHGTGRGPRLTAPGNDASSLIVMAGWSRGSLRKNQSQTTSQSRVTAPSTAKETRQDENTSSPAINDGVTALPILANEWTIPCAKPQLPRGVQLAMARLAAGKPAPSPKPNARRTAKRDATPLTAPVSAGDSATTPQHIASVSLAPRLSPTQPPIS